MTLNFMELAIFLNIEFADLIFFAFNMLNSLGNKDTFSFIHIENAWSVESLGPGRQR